ncbi:glycine cleavage system protein H [bacterium]|nr:glycine cleavage system protein H [bacterium]MBU1881146.1 glycine cleavage system protein H [bacterium]
MSQSQNNSPPKPRYPFPEDLFLHREYTWVRVESHELGDRLRIGVTEIFLRDVGEVLLLDLPNEGDEVSQDEVCGLIRGKGTKKDFYAPVSGEILDVNLELHEDPDIIREDPYGIGWLMLVDPNEFEEESEDLLSGKTALAWWEAELAMRRTKLNNE